MKFTYSKKSLSKVYKYELKCYTGLVRIEQNHCLILGSDEKLSVYAVMLCLVVGHTTQAWTLFCTA